MINLGLLGMAALAIGISTMAFMGVGALRGHVDNWTWTADVASESDALGRLIELSFSKQREVADAEFLDAFDALDGAIHARRERTAVTAALAANTAAARNAFLNDRHQRDIADQEVTKLEEASAILRALLADEVASVKSQKLASDRRSSALEAAQRAGIVRITRFVDATTAGQRIRTQLTSLIDFGDVLEADRVAVDLTGLPTGCGVGEKNVTEAYCKPSPARLQARVALLNATRQPERREAATRDALRAVNAYLRALRFSFEEESAALASSIDALKQERAAKRDLSVRLEGLARVGRALQQFRADVAALPSALPEQIARLDRETRSHLAQIRLRGRGIFRPEEVGEQSAAGMTRAAVELDIAWTSAVEAMVSHHAAAAGMRDALESMRSGIAHKAARVRTGAGDWIQSFTSATLVATLVFGFVVTGTAFLAFRMVARPIGRITELILQLARDGVEKPIDASQEGRSLGELFRALEMLRLSSNARKEAERRALSAAQELARAHDRLTRIANTAPAGLYELNMHADGTLEFPYVSRKFEMMFGVAEGTRDADDVFVNVQPDDRGALFRAIMESAMSLEPMRHRHRVVHPDRGVIWLVNASTPVLDQDGIVHWVGTVADVTEEVRYEQELETARTRAEAASQAKSQFLATMSHELRTPMNGIIGMADLLSETQLDGDQRQCSDTIRDSAQALLALINDILDISRVEAGKVVLQSEPVCVSRLLDDVAQLLSNAAAEKGVQILVDDRLDAVTGRGTLWFLTDSARLRQVLVNIVGNAVKFTPEGRVVISAQPVSEHAQDGPQDVVIAVSDTGIGIPADKLARIFDPFEQADSSISRRFEGSGLGLAICRSLVTAMGGQISVSSVVGEGTTFTLRLPMAITEPESRRERPAAEVSGLVAALLSSDGESRRIIGAMLREEGLRVRDVELAELRGIGAEIDLAVLDLDPKGSITLTDFRTRLEAAAAVPPMLVLSPQDAGEPIPGRLAFQRKPCRQSGLRAALLRLLRPGRAAEPEPMAENGVPDLSARAILIAEDNKTNRLVMKRILGPTGAALTFAENGSEAVAAFHAEHFDLVLMDISMPVMDGLQATREIRRIEGERDSGPSCPVVAVTAHAMPEDHERCLASGADVVLTKPVRKNALTGLLRDMLAPGPSGQANVPHHAPPEPPLQASAGAYR